MKQCLHISRFRHWHGYVGESSYHETCMTCGELLPLGPAKLDDNARNELRAAELAQMSPAARTASMSLTERDGWHTTSPPYGWPLYFTEWAGWLAWQIVEHDKESP